MDTPKPGWTPYVVYITEILQFLNTTEILISNGKTSLKKSNTSNPGHLLHSSYPYPLDQRRPADKNDNF